MDDSNSFINPSALQESDNKNISSLSQFGINRSSKKIKNRYIHKSLDLGDSKEKVNEILKNANTSKFSPNINVPPLIVAQ
jgi:hypothetical protein